MGATKTSTVRNAVDTWSDSTKPSKENPRTWRMGVQSGGNANAYLYFGFPAPRKATILSAKLRLWTAGSWGGASSTVTVQRLTQKFVVSKLNHNNQPAAGGASVSVTKTSSGDGNLWEFNVSAMMQLVADGTPWYGFKITSNSATRRFFRAAQAGGLRPELEVTWADAPDQPTTLFPAGAVISVPSPVLEMDYTDPTSGKLTAAQVQVNPTNVFTAPAYDSGEVVQTAGTKARVDLSVAQPGGAYPGLAAGGLAYWRGRVKDESGVWSAWSAPVTFSRLAKGTLTINSPSSGSPTVSDFTPPLTWTFTPPAGHTQEKFRLIVNRVDTGTEVFDTEDVPGTASQATIQGKGGKAVIAAGITYRATLRVWDTADRIGSSTDPAFVEVTRDFSYSAGATSAPTALAATVTTGPPGVTLTWTSTSAPDSYTFTLDGRPVRTGVLASAVFVSGTTYSYTFTDVRPNTTATFGVTAVVSGVSSTTATVNVKPRISGFWLIDQEVRSRYLFLANTSGSTIVLGEDGETHIPLGASVGVRVTQGLRGYEGTITGDLVAVDGMGRTLQQWVDEALGMRGRPGRTYMLLLGTESIEVVIGNLTVRPTGDSKPGTRSISFDFWQTDDSRIAVTL